MGQTEAKIVQAHKAQLDQYIGLFWPKLDPQNTGFLTQQGIQTLMVTAYKLFAQQYGYQTARTLEELIAEWVGVFDPNRTGQVARADFMATYGRLAEGQALVGVPAAPQEGGQGDTPQQQAQQPQQVQQRGPQQKAQRPVVSSHPIVHYSCAEGKKGSIRKSEDRSTSSSS
jgi:hypothetical protein